LEKLDKRKKAVFLDRDGTINSDEYGYVKDTHEFQLYSFAKKALTKLKKCNLLLFLVTNQSGIARGYYSFADLATIHSKMQNQLGEAAFDDIFISPYHIQGFVKPYNISHADRKPGLGMFKQAVQKHDFQIKGSYMIGDKYTDIEFGKKAGLITILVQTGKGREEFLFKRQEWSYKPDFIADNLLVAAELIEKLEKK
jgi:D,D-heptose 1,7-bisphosphate phosphatase